jgi:sodium/bile acid cotransporter 7
VLRKIFPDRFILWLIGAVALASLLPVRGPLAGAVDTLTLAAIFALFFLHGVRLPREALLSGVADWRLHAAILASTFLIFPAAGLLLSLAFPGLLTPALWTGCCSCARCHPRSSRRSPTLRWRAATSREPWRRRPSPT